MDTFEYTIRMRDYGRQKTYSLWLIGPKSALPITTFRAVDSNETITRLIEERNGALIFHGMYNKSCIDSVVNELAREVQADDMLARLDMMNFQGGNDAS